MVPQGPAPRTTAVLSLSTRTAAGTPPSRAKQPVWQLCHDSASRPRDHTIASRRLQDSTMCSATRSTTSSPSSSPGKCAQSTCACAPAGVSTRRRARTAGTGQARRQ
jgi:hypothetical protein